MNTAPKASSSKPAPFSLADLFAGSQTAFWLVLLGGLLTVLLSFFWFFRLAPPKAIVLTSGREDSVFRRHADRYREILARSGIQVKVLPSEGSLQNLQRLANPSFRVDAGFVQDGEAREVKAEGLVSLGSLYHEPLLVFYRGPAPVKLLSGFQGKRVGVGPVGSGTNDLSLALLAENGIRPSGRTRLVEADAEDAASALLSGKLDAAFMMGDTASSKIVRELLRAPGIRLLDFPQADGYTRRFPFLSRLILPRGSIDFGKDIPAHDVDLIGATVELVARPDLDPAVSDLLIEAARDIHGRAGLFRRQGEFPAVSSRDFKLGPEAARFYQSGKSFFYRFLPFWLASFVNRIVVVFIPLLVVLVPIVRLVPAAFRWRMNLILYRWYRALLVLEQDMLKHLNAKNRGDLLARLEHIESAVNRIKVSAPFAGQFYELRGHIRFVRSHLEG